MCRKYNKILQCIAVIKYHLWLMTTNSLKCDQKDTVSDYVIILQVKYIQVWHITHYHIEHSQVLIYSYLLMILIGLQGMAVNSVGGLPYGILHWSVRR